MNFSHNGASVPEKNIDAVCRPSAKIWLDPSPDWGKARYDNINPNKNDKIFTKNSNTVGDGIGLDLPQQDAAYHK